MKYLGTVFALACGISLVGVPSQAQENPYDLLIIESIQCIKPAGGLDAAGSTGFAALGAAIAAAGTAALGAATIVTTGGAATAMVVPVGPGALVAAAGGGAGTAVTATKFLDGEFSGQDDLIVEVNGKQLLPILPTSSKFQPMVAGQTLETNLKASFAGSARISLIEYDSGSDNDDLGSVTIPGGTSYSSKAFILAPRKEDGSIYVVTYKVEAGKGNPNEIVQNIRCGTNACLDARVDYVGKLDRDKDHADLKSCPPGFQSVDFEKFPQKIVADVYLRKCHLMPVSVKWLTPPLGRHWPLRPRNLAKVLRRLSIWSPHCLATTKTTCTTRVARTIGTSCESRGSTTRS